MTSPTSSSMTSSRKTTPMSVPSRVDHPGEVGAGALHGAQHLLDLVGGLHRRELADPLDRDGDVALGVVGVEHVLEVQVAGRARPTGRASGSARTRAWPPAARRRRGSRSAAGSRGRTAATATSTASLSLNSRAAPTSPCWPSSIRPSCRLSARMCSTSSTVNAEVISSLGSTRNSRTSDFAIDSITEMIGRSVRVMNSSTGTRISAERSGPASARFLGIISPTTTCR